MDLADLALPEGRFLVDSAVDNWAKSLARRSRELS